MAVRVSSKGQIVIPVEIREKYGIKSGTELELEEEEGAIKLIPPTKLSDLCATWELDREKARKEIGKMRADW